VRPDAEAMGRDKGAHKNAAAAGSCTGGPETLSSTLTFAFAVDVTVRSKGLAAACCTNALQAPFSRHHSPHLSIFAAFYVFVAMQ
jgi:hypothetical protein